LELWAQAWARALIPSGICAQYRDTPLRHPICSCSLFSVRSVTIVALRSGPVLSATKILWGQILVVSMIVLAAIWGATQWTAWRLGYQPQLGTPWTEIAGTPVYPPPVFFLWWYWFDAYAPRIFIEGAIIASSGGFAAIAIAIGMSVWRAREVKEATTYGSARWATAQEIRKAGLLKPDGVVLGCFGREYLRHDGPEHVLCFAPTRSGKGVGLVVPTLLTWPGSAIVHDIKGENWQLTAGWRARFARVLLFDPTNSESSAYNPLLEVRRGDAEVRDVQNVADILVDPEGALERRNHWEKTSHSLLVGAILHVLYAEADKTLAGVANFLSDPRRPIATTLRAMMMTQHLGDRPHPVVASAARELLNKSENERSGVLSTAMSFLGLYRDPVVAKVTRRCDWRIADLVECEQPATLYLVVPPSDISRTKPLVRLVLNQIGRRLTEELETRRRRHRLLLMLDEFPALGRLDFFETALAFMAGYGLKSFLIAQSLNLPCPGLVRDQRRAHGQAGLGRARHRDRTARHEELCGPSPIAMARTSHDLAPGDGTAALDRRRSDAAPAQRRARAGLGLSPDPRQEGAVLRGRAAQSPRPSTTLAGRCQRGHLRRSTQ
jgi:type IV secretion system protein VirD4